MNGSRQRAEARPAVEKGDSRRMDGIPNTPNGAPADALQPSAVCPACGATVATQATFCGACGEVLPTPDVGREAAQVAPAAPVPVQPATTTSRAQAGELALSAAGKGKICSWCGAVNAPDAKTCSSCDATFPTPEGDEALDRAARERIEDMQAEISKNSKSRGSSWWPFRSR